MSIRKITSLVAALAFLVMMLTSIILYIVPQGRIAYWAGWELWGLSKTQWGDLHINTGVLFFIALGLHTYYNWGAIAKYLKNPSKQLTIFTKEFNVALVLTLTFIAGTLFQVQPFSGIINVSEGIKDNAAIKYGEPPWGHAELSSLKGFTSKSGLDLDKSISLLSAAGIQVSDTKQSLLTISKANHTTPQVIFDTIKPATLPEPLTATIQTGTLPPRSPNGFGKMSIEDFATKYGVKPGKIIQLLETEEIKATKEMTMKQVAAKAGTIPSELYEIFKAL